MSKRHIWDNICWCLSLLCKRGLFWVSTMVETMRGQGRERNLCVSHPPSLLLTAYPGTIMLYSLFLKSHQKALSLFYLPPKDPHSEYSNTMTIPCLFNLFYILKSVFWFVFLFVCFSRIDPNTVFVTTSSFRNRA